MKFKKSCFGVKEISGISVRISIFESCYPSKLMAFWNFLINRGPRFKIALCSWLCLGWLLQIPMLAAFTHEADWKFETLQNSSHEWWQTLRIKTVPGVVYHLQKNSDLSTGNWVNTETLYGTGAEWICPIFRGSEPTTLPIGNPVLLNSPSHPVNQISLTLEKSTNGDTLISWDSLDDYTPQRQILSDVTLSPIWESFESSYQNTHGNYYFSVNPRLGAAVTFSGSSSATGPQDTAMISAFKAALAGITSNIESNQTHAASYASPPATSGSREFYRFSADWSVNSDSDSRLDWQEIVLDHNNPYAADSNGDGAPDQAAPSSEINPDEFPTPGDVDEPTPQAMIQQIQLQPYRTERYSSGTTDPGPHVNSGTIKTGSDGTFNNSGDYSSFQSQVQQSNLQSYGVSFNPTCNSTDLEKIGSSAKSVGELG